MMSISSIFRRIRLWLGICSLVLRIGKNVRAPLTIHFGGQANLFDSVRRQEKAALASAKSDLPSLPEYKNILLAAQKQLLELPLMLVLAVCYVNLFLNWLLILSSGAIIKAGFGIL